MVHTIAMRQVADPHLAEEVAQSVFIIFSRKASQLSSRASVCGWLVQTARFVSRDAVKLRQRRQKNEQEFAASLEPSLPPTTARNTIEAMLDEALLELPAGEQAGVMAHFFEGRNFKEIGDMLAISEDGAQKRVSRSLAKLRAFLTRRGAKVPMTALAGLLTAQFARETAVQASPSALHGAQAAAQGKLAEGNALALANRAARLLGRRSAIGFSLKLALAGILVIGGARAWLEWSIPRRSTVQVSDPRIEALGQRWSVMVLRIASVKKEFAQTSLNDPRFQTLLAQVNSFAEDAAPIRDELNVLLTPPHERDQVAEFLAAEVVATLKLDASERRAMFSLVRDRLARGATLTDAMKAMAGDIPAEADQIKALLSLDHRQSFDSIYGAEGSCLFVYLRIATAGK
jgi:RNA polymerase sigma factor (sigma-70 family)